MEQKVLAYIRQNELLQPGDTVTVALSGGADSMALLTVLHALRQALQVELRAAHFHHGLRGEEADRDAAFAEARCRRLGIPFRRGGGDTAARAKQTGESLEEAARKLRYGFLLQAAPGKLATAHNADDNAETVLLNLLRGSGLRGLAGIPPRRGRIVRPLLCCDRRQILAYLEQKGVTWRTDSTNDADDCRRNRLRHRVLPLLRAENPSFSASVLRTSALLRAQDAYLSRLAAEAEAGCRTEAGHSCKKLLALDPVLRRRVLLGLLWRLPLENPSEGFVSGLEGLLASPRPSARLALPQGWIAAREYDLLRFSRGPEAERLEHAPLNLPGTTVLSGKNGRIEAVVTKNSKNLQKNPYTFLLRYDMIAANRWSVRARRPGDRLTLPGGTKTLKRLMIDRKLPKARRDRIPVLVCGETVAAVPGLGVDLRFRPGPEDETVLAVTYRAEPPGSCDDFRLSGGQEGEVL